MLGGEDVLPARVHGMSADPYGMSPVFHPVPGGSDRVSRGWGGDGMSGDEDSVSASQDTLPGRSDGLSHGKNGVSGQDHTLPEGSHHVPGHEDGMPGRRHGLPHDPDPVPDGWRVDPVSDGAHILPNRGDGVPRYRDNLPEEANENAFLPGDWYRTGDVGWMEEEGWLHLTDRLKEMIKVSGFQVAPAEIEAVLLSNPVVSDCAVFGVPHPRRGQVPWAAVVVKTGEEVSEAELIDFSAEQLANYKRLDGIDFCDTIPRTPSGKALRRVLTARHEPGGAGDSEGVPSDPTKGKR